MRIGWIGVHEEGIAALDAVCAAGYDVVGFITLKQEKADRRCGSGSYDSICQRYQIPTFEVAHINDSSSLKILDELSCDLLVVLGWGQILSGEALARPTIGTVGAHASMLPHNRGSAPVNWAIIRGEPSTGNSLMWLADGVDTGRLIDQRAFPITPFDTCDSIYHHVGQSNRDMMLSLLEQLSAGMKPGRPQLHTDEEILPRRRPSDGLIDWGLSASSIYNLVRGVTRPYPGAFGCVNGQELKIWNCALLPPIECRAVPGTVLGPVISPEEKSCGVLIATGQGVLVLLEVEDKSGNVITGRQLCERPWAQVRLKEAA